MKGADLSLMTMPWDKHEQLQKRRAELSGKLPAVDQLFDELAVLLKGEKDGPT